MIDQATLNELSRLHLALNDIQQAVQRMEIHVAGRGTSQNLKTAMSNLEQAGAMINQEVEAISKKIFGPRIPMCGRPVI